MNAIRTAIVVAVATLSATAALAQTAAGPVQRDINQQTRIEQGLQSGTLTTREAARLERGESRIDRVEARDLRRGPLTPQEQARIDRMQNAESRAIRAEKHDGIYGNPASLSSQRLQADVQRNLSQERRIEQGIANGSLNDRQAGNLEAGQARAERAEWRAGRDGWVGAGQQAHVQSLENRQSNRIFAAKHR
jgi:hypothetical protein